MNRLPYPIDQKHFDTFAAIIQDKISPCRTYLGRNVVSWAKHDADRVFPKEFNARLNRIQLAEICHDQTRSAEELIPLILAWGGMREGNRKILFGKPDNITVLTHLVTELRSGKITTRCDAFEVFASARAAGRLPGLGIGYYTKLIFFLRPDLKGYIMDQWVTKSINLIFGHTVKINQYGWVDDSNTSDHYEKFCSRIEQLAMQTGEKHPANTEEKLFSNGGRKKGDWRAYVISNT